MEGCSEKGAWVGSGTWAGRREELSQLRNSGIARGRAGVGPCLPKAECGGVLPGTGLSPLAGVVFLSTLALIKPDIVCFLDDGQGNNKMKAGGYFLKRVVLNTCHQ